MVIFSKYEDTATAGDAKRYFSKNGAPAAKIGSDYLTGSAIRQDYLETAISWISDGNIEVYMSNQYKDKIFDYQQIDDEVKLLVLDDDVKKNRYLFIHPY